MEYPTAHKVAAEHAQMVARLVADELEARARAAFWEVQWSTHSPGVGWEPFAVSGGGMSICWRRRQP